MWTSITIDWTVINIPVQNVVDIVLSTKLDLAVVISCVFPWESFLSFSSHLLFLLWDQKINRAKVENEGQEEETCHLAVRPLRFRDGTPHPYAMVPTMQFSVTGTSASQMTRAQVLGDHLLLWIPAASERLGLLRRHSVVKLYVIAWKQGSITLVSSVFIITYHIDCDIDDAGSSGKVLRGSTETST
jgi:hypothetical protein